MTNYQFSFDPVDVDFVATKHRLIQTAIPVKGTKEIFERLKKVESRSMHGQLPIVWDKAEGFKVYDMAGNCWIDFTSTIFVANVGHSNARVSRAIRETLDNPLFSCYAYSNLKRAEYLEKLITFAGHPFEKAFLLSAGTEATEAAMKLMRMYGQRKKKRRLGIICLENNWHGRTLGAQMMSGNEGQKEWIGYKDQDIHHIPFPYPWVVNDEEAEGFLDRSINNLKINGIDMNRDVCGFTLETFQGWGAIFYPKQFVKRIKEICHKHDILLTFDEMQSGFARTGKKFGYEHYEVVPDLLCVGKGMGGGVPLSGVIGTGEIMDLPEIGNMSSTHSANPLVCSAGLAVLNEIDRESLVEQASKKGEILFKFLQKIKSKFSNKVSYTFCKGLIAAILFHEKNKPDSQFASKVAEKCMQKGLLVVHTGRESIKIGPPLVITSEALKEGLQVLEESINELIN